MLDKTHQMEEQSIGVQPYKNRIILYLNYVLIGEVDNYSWEEYAPTLSINLKNFVPTIESTKIFEMNKSIHVALVNVETYNAYTTNMWVTSWNTNGALRLTGRQYLKEELLWLKKIKLMSFW